MSSDRQCEEPAKKRPRPDEQEQEDAPKSGWDYNDRAHASVDAWLHDCQICKRKRVLAVAPLMRSDSLWRLAEPNSEHREYCCLCMYDDDEEESPGELSQEIARLTKKLEEMNAVVIKARTRSYRRKRVIYALCYKIWDLQEFVKNNVPEGDDQEESS